MLHLIVRNGICHKWSSSVRLTSVSRIPVKVDSKTQDDDLENIENVAVPVNQKPTIDASKRITSSAEIVKNDTKQSLTEKHLDPLNQWVITPAPITSAKQLFRNYKKLSKFRLTSLVIITSMAGYAMAPAPFELSTFLMCSLGTGLLSAAANAINQFHEVPFDAQMSRTKNRVIVMGQLTPTHAIGFAFCAATTGLSILYFGVNEFTAALGAGNLFLYTSIYTPMKRFSILNTWVGSVVGSIPPLMGWAGCAGSLDAGAWILAGLLYAWQFPHFNALSWNLRPDYSRAGYRMMAVTNPGLCRRTALRYTVIISALSLAAPYYDVTNQWFALETLPLNAYFCYLAWKFYKNSDSGSSRKLFRYSLIHLPALMILFLLNKKRWIFTEKSEIPIEAVITGNLPIATATLIDSDNKENTLLQISTLSPSSSSKNTSLSKVLPIAIAAPASPSTTVSISSSSVTNLKQTATTLVDS